MTRRLSLPRSESLTEAKIRRETFSTLHLHYITCHLADAFIQSDLQ